MKALVAQLPKELQGKNPPRPDEALILPKDQVLEQLAQGAVKVPFGQVRRIASTGVLAGGSSHDNRMVDVPLKEILAQLRGDAFPRRQDQRVIHVPDEIHDIFGAKGEARAQMRVMQKDELKPAPKSETQGQAEPTPMPVYQTPTAASFTPQPLPQQQRIAISGAPQPAAAPRPPGPMQPIQRNEFLSFEIKEVSANWPENVKREIQRVGAQNSKCLLPTAEIQEALKQGRVSYTWKQISGRLQPGLAPHTQISNDDAVLELPIAAVASAFFTQTQAANVNRPAVKAPANIEPVFRGGPQQQQSAQVQQQRPITQPAAQPLPPQQAIPLRMQPEAPAAQAAPAPRPVPAAPAPRPAAPTPPGGSKGNVTFKISDVWANWPQEVKAVVNSSRIAAAQVAIPFEFVEPGLRTGKIEFAWAEFCGWVDNCPAEAQSALPAETRVALPLAVLAPLCLRLSPPTQRKAATFDDIPDIFGPAGQTADPEADEEEEDAPVFQKGPAPAPARPAPQPAHAPAPPPRPSTPPQPTYTPAPPPHVPAQAVDAGTNAKNLAELFGEPGKRNWTPNEIVQHTAQLPGVSGALIALQDGLLVANCMPTNWKSETIAAFLPQIFGRMSQYVKELSMGDLISVTVAVEQGTLQVYKAGIIYFAALARPDATLPLAPLNLIARELSRHTK
jgi:predicted regulator of Ras-like GTPase activity (Roadblock/LC7/MglB family)